MESQSRSRAWLFASVVLVAISLLADGCGGASASAGEHTRSGATGKPHKSAAQNARAIASAEAICTRVSAELLRAPAPKNASAREILRVTPAHAAIEQRGNAELSKLKASSSIAHAWTVVLQDRLTLAGELQTVIGFENAKNETGLRELLQRKATQRTALLQAAQVAGITACGEVG